MSNSTTALDVIIQGTGAQDLQANALFDAASTAMCYARRASTTVSTTWGYYGGIVSIAGVRTSIPNGIISLSASAANYVQAHPDTGAVSSNSTAFTVGYIPLYIVTTAATTIQSWVDVRSFVTLNDTLVKALTDANTTLTMAEASAKTLTFSGTLTATRNVVLPLIGKNTWIVYNGTTQSLQFIGPTGSGTTIDSTAYSIILSDGTNINNVALSGSSGSSGSTIQTIVTDSTTARTLALTDVDSWIRFTNSSSINMTVPANSSVAFQVGITLNGVQAAAGQVTIVASGGVTVNVPSGYNAKTRAQGSTWGLIKVDTNTWDLIGDLEATV